MQFIKALSIIKDIFDLIAIGLKQFKKHRHNKSIKDIGRAFDEKRETRKEKIDNVKNISDAFNSKFH